MTQKGTIPAFAAALALIAAGAAVATPEAAELAALERAIFEAASQGPERVGEEIRVTYRSPELAASAAEAAGPVWRQEIHYSGASYIAPHFERFHLPPGARLVVRSPDGSRSRTYTGFGKADLGRRDGFWGQHVPGDTAVLELYSNRPVPAAAVEVDSFAHGYPAESFVPDSGDEAICGADDSDWARCYQNSEPTIYDRSRAVLRLLIQGTSACTGWLIGSEGHVMTNEHCVGSSNAALNTDYEVMAEGATCSTNCASFGACPGTILSDTGTLVQLDSALDYSLILLPSNPTSSFGFLQMRGSGAAVGERIYIPGHPAAWGKRISVDSSASQDSSGFCEVDSLSAFPCSGGPGDVGYFCDTRGGSSGSPVVAYADHAVVALHHCANCPNRGVPVGAIINDLGGNLPLDAVVGGDPPPPPPPPTCSAKDASCTSDGQCCSGKCKGKTGSKTCR